MEKHHTIFNSHGAFTSALTRQICPEDVQMLESSRLPSILSRTKLNKPFWHTVSNRLEWPCTALVSLCNFHTSLFWWQTPFILWQIPAEQPEELFDILDEDWLSCASGEQVTTKQTIKQFQKCFRHCFRVGMNHSRFKSQTPALAPMAAFRQEGRRVLRIHMLCKDQLGSITFLQFHESVKHLWRSKCGVLRVSSMKLWNNRQCRHVTKELTII